MAEHDQDVDQVNGALKFKVLNNFEISPPQGSVPTTNIPLTFFDYLYLICSECKFIFLYEFPYPTHHFLETILPSLKQSLSLTLQHFFPFAATLVFPPEPIKPYIRYVADSESSTVTFTVAESTMDFNHIIADHPIDINELDAFAPLKPPVSVLEDGTRLFPLLAIQVTVMPNSGFCIGINYHHAIADGTAFMLFMKAWASVCKRLLMSTKTDEVEEEEEGKHFSLPIFNDGDMVQDPNGIDLSYLNMWWKPSPVNSYMLERQGTSSSNDMHKNTKENHSFEAKGTMQLSQVQVDKLKNWISLKYNEYFTSESQDQISSVPLHLSTFVAASALLWVCWVKLEDNIDIGDDELYHFLIVVNCRGRYEFVSIPSTYFGNFGALSYVTLKKRQLLGENGIVEAAKAIGNKLEELDKNGVMKGSETWPLDFTEKLISGRGVVAAGRPNLGLYETDFGVGRPKKCEFLGLQGGKSFTVFDSKDMNAGGVEVGFAFERTKLNNFIEIIQQSLKIL
ncbi:Malonyl-coenzyme:anthocyanin 5-O-glucoside-6'''-O-malonyltransferase [Quillaja saponaria]|uniref:Malonyl-coenzyme:anthocyanin 5-O-glucoside-6'''-O-malonyltransferase n=1 Tax=Quillaja saponaria TaxID=32244 RepID=A0AAD7PS34_QUISA|nr:Malonyl-coenzyme:anthocyanin 5-O-glucoside-6'''-O-malonyltransferase [Quillaja saponaria]